MKVKTLSRPNSSTGVREIYGIQVVNLPKVGKQKLVPAWVDRFKQFITQDAEKIVLHTVDGDVIFNIDHACINNAPTRYCLTCNEVLPDQRADPFAEQSRAHVAAHGDSAEKSDRWPPGYMVVNSFECTVEDRRHG